MFSKHVGVMDSNEVEGLAISETIQIYWPSFFIFRKLVIECDSSNSICRVSSTSEDPWKFHFLLVEIKSLSSLVQVTFKHEKRGINLMADSVANQEVDREVFLVAPSL